MPIDLSEKQSEAWHLLEDDQTTEILFGGGGGGGKTYLGCVWHISRRTRYAGSRGLIGRNNKSDIKESTLITFFNVCNQLGYVKDRDYIYSEHKSIIVWSNGSRTVLKELKYQPSDPDFHSLGSTEYTDVFIEEGAEITQKAFEIVTSRIRYKLSEFNLKPKCLITCNPNQGWIKKRYIKDKMGNPTVLEPHQVFIQALVDDNPDEDFKRIYIEQLNRMTNPYDKLRLRSGDWDAKEEIDVFATQFDRKRHVSENIELDLNKPLFTSKDFNLSPFACIAAHVWNDEKGFHFHIVDEFDIEKGSIEAMKEQYKMRYFPWLHSISMTGDYMGKRKEISQSDNASNYLQLQRGLGLRDSQIKTIPNPTHKFSREQCNYVFFHHPDVKISKKCERLLFDLENVQVNEHGEIIKDNRKHEEQRADYLDAFRYMVNTFLRPWIELHQKSHQ